MRIYNKETNNQGQEVIWYEENGFRISFLANPSNRDYQEYLKSLEA
jgi:hypothetical protein